MRVVAENYEQTHTHTRDNSGPYAGCPKGGLHSGTDAGYSWRSGGRCKHSSGVRGKCDFQYFYNLDILFYHQCLINVLL